MRTGAEKAKNKLPADYDQNRNFMSFTHLHFLNWEIKIKMEQKITNLGAQRMFL